MMECRWCHKVQAEVGGRTCAGCREDLVRRITGLLNLAGSPNPNEATVAMAKANDLLMKYNLSLGDVRRTDVGNDIEIEVIQILREVYTWRELWVALADYNLCKVIYSPVISRGHGRVYLVGSSENRAAVKAMFQWVQPQVQRLVLREGMALRPRHIGAQAWKQSWVLGCVERVERRLMESRQRFVAQSTRTSLALRTIDQGVQDWIDLRLGRDLRAPKDHTWEAEALLSGYRSGDKVALIGQDRQVQGGDNSTLLEGEGAV